MLEGVIEAIDDVVGVSKNSFLGGGTVYEENCGADGVVGVTCL